MFLTIDIDHLTHSVATTIRCLSVRHHHSNVWLTIYHDYSFTMIYLVVWSVFDHCHWLPDLFGCDYYSLYSLFIIFIVQYDSSFTMIIRLLIRLLRVDSRHHLTNSVAITMRCTSGTVWLIYDDSHWIFFLIQLLLISYVCYCKWTVYKAIMNNRWLI